MPLCAPTATTAVRQRICHKLYVFIVPEVHIGSIGADLLEALT